MSKPNAPDVRMVPIGELVPYANNARTHSPAQVATIAASIREFGWTVPVLTDGAGGIIAGHGRVLAAAKLRMTEVPVIELAHLSPAQKRAYILADNRIAEASGWDDDLLKIELGALKADGFDMGLTGFDMGDLDRLLGGGGGSTDPDDVPEAPASPVSRLGDIWNLGSHRLYADDCALVLETVPGKIAAVITDPPYGIDYNHAGSESRFKNTGWGKASRRRGNPSIAGDDRPFDPTPLLSFQNVIMWGADHFKVRLPNTGRFLAFDKLAGMEPWDSFSDVEFAWHSIAGASRIFSMKWKGIACEKQGEDNGLRLHTTQKPIRLMRWCIEQADPKPGLILDPYAGSGTTIIAAEMMGRTCVGIEIEPRYIDIAVLRWQAFTGKAATLATDGRSFAEIAEERAT